MATEAAARVRDWAFENFAPPRLVSYILPQNERSRRVAEKLGAVRDDTIVLRGHASEVWIHKRPGQGVVV